MGSVRTFLSEARLTQRIISLESESSSEAGGLRWAPRLLAGKRGGGVSSDGESSSVEALGSGGGGALLKDRWCEEIGRSTMEELKLSPVEGPWEFRE